MRSAITAVLSLVLLSITHTTASPAQLPLRPASTRHDQPHAEAHKSIAIQGSPTGFAESIVSALSASSKHTTFLRLLQRAKCIPLLAHIGSSTVFAPTDEAWDAWAEKHRPEEEDDLVQGWLGPDGLDEWLKDEEDVLASRVAMTMDDEGERQRLDNQNWALRQHLLYHMLNYTLQASAIIAGNSSNVTIETTLLFPLLEEPEHPPVPEPGPPWLPRGGEGLLGGHGQRLRLARAGSGAGGERGKVGVDHFGEGGVTVWDGRGWNSGDETEFMGAKNVTGARWVRNGVVIGVDGVLEPPPSIGTLLSGRSGLTQQRRSSGSTLL
jgi:uncharacterized surface protein with fasciclin (FAS1) repeats